MLMVITILIHWCHIKLLSPRNKKRNGLIILRLNVQDYLGLLSTTCKLLYNDGEVVGLRNEHIFNYQVSQGMNYGPTRATLVP